MHFITQKVKTKSLLCITQYLSSWQPRLPLYEWIHLVKLACSILTLKTKTSPKKSDARDLGAPIKHDPPRLQGFIRAWHKCVWLFCLYIDRRKWRGKGLFIWLPANSNIDPRVGGIPSWHLTDLPITSPISRCMQHKTYGNSGFRAYRGWFMRWMRLKKKSFTKAQRSISDSNYQSHRERAQVIAHRKWNGQWAHEYYRG